jgi:hypothetical protein
MLQVGLGDWDRAMVSVTDVETALAAVSSLAVILGVGFVIVQLRQNSRLLEATLRQQRSDVSVALIERITDESFPRRRSHMHEVLRRFKATNWKDAFETPDDFEVRNFAYIYELIGVMAKHGLVDLDLLTDVLQYLIVRDWEVFEPHAKFIRESYKVQFDPYSNFRWIANETQKRLAPRTQAPVEPIVAMKSN